MENIKRINPTEWIVFSTFGLTGLPLIFSISKNNNLPPSNAGIGSKLINPTLRKKDSTTKEVVINPKKIEENGTESYQFGK